MNKYNAVAILLTLLAGLPSCKKAMNTNDRLIGMWNIDSVQVRMFINNQVTYQTIYKPASDYYDFREDNKLYRLWMNRYDTVPYQVVSWNGRTLVQYSYSADTIISINNHSLIFKNPQGSDSKIFFSK